MFLGHFALAFAAKRAAPRLSLAALFAGAQLADLIWPALVALGLERVRIDPGHTAVTPLAFEHYPYSHSLVVLLAWGLLFGAATTGRRDRRAFTVVAALVVSHWVLDAVTHRPDLPLYPGGPRIGAGLWNSVPATLAVEGALFALGVGTYAACTRSRDRAGRWGLAALVVFLLAVYGANLVGGPPPSVGAIVVAGLFGGVLLIAWSWWVDRHRVLAPPAMRPGTRA
jgi:hypothetical protein